MINSKYYMKQYLESKNSQKQNTKEKLFKESYYYLMWYSHYQIERFSNKVTNDNQKINGLNDQEVLKKRLKHISIISAYNKIINLLITDIDYEFGISGNKTYEINKLLNEIERMKKASKDEYKKYINIRDILNYISDTVDVAFFRDSQILERNKKIKLEKYILELKKAFKILYNIGENHIILHANTYLNYLSTYNIKVYTEENLEDSIYDHYSLYIKDIDLLECYRKTISVAVENGHISLIQKSLSRLNSLEDIEKMISTIKEKINELSTISDYSFKSTKDNISYVEKIIRIAKKNELKSLDLLEYQKVIAELDNIIPNNT